MNLNEQQQQVIESFLLTAQLDQQMRAVGDSIRKSDMVELSPRIMYDVEHGHDASQKLLINYYSYLKENQPDHSYHEPLARLIVIDPVLT